MSRNPDDLELTCIHEMTKQSPQIQDLLQEKFKQVKELVQKQFVKSKKPEPAPKPKGDVKFSKIHTTRTMDDKTLQDKIHQSNVRFDQKIKKEMDVMAKHPDNEPVKDIVHDMKAEDLSLIAEKGEQAYKDKQVEKQQELEQELALSLDDLDNKTGKSFLSLEYEDNSKDIVQDYPMPSEPANDFE